MFSEGKENTERDMLKPHKTWGNYFTGPRWLQAGLHLYRDIVLHLEWYKTSTRWTPNPASHTQTLAEDGDYERGLNHSLLDSKCQRLELIKSQLWALSQNHASFPLHTAVTSNKPTSALQFTTVQLPNSVTKKMLSSSPRMMARGVELSMRHWCHSTPGERIRKAEGKTASAECRSWLVRSRPKGTKLTIYPKLKYVSLNRSHNSSFSLNMCVTAILSCLFSAHHTQCLVILQGLPSPLALCTQLSYRGSGSHLPGSLLSTGRHGHLQYWRTWRRWEGKLRYPSDIHLYLWAKWWASEIHRQSWYKGKE